MNDVLPERVWFEKANQNLDMARRALGGTILKILKSCQSRFRQV